MRLELNAKLVEVNNFLADQEKARDDIDRLRDSREADMRKNFENSRRALEVSLRSKLTSCRRLAVINIFKRLIV